MLLLFTTALLVFLLGRLFDPSLMCSEWYLIKQILPSIAFSFHARPLIDSFTFTVVLLKLSNIRIRPEPEAVRLTREGEGGEEEEKIALSNASPKATLTGPRRRGPAKV